jgi:hypothetical protein
MLSKPHLRIFVAGLGGLRLDRSECSEVLNLLEQDLGFPIVSLDRSMTSVGASVEFKVKFANPGREFLSIAVTVLR